MMIDISLLRLTLANFVPVVGTCDDLGLCSGEQMDHLRDLSRCIVTEPPRSLEDACRYILLGRVVFRKQLSLLIF